MKPMATSPDEIVPSPLHADLIEMLRAAHAAECDIFGALSPDQREAPNTFGEWSAKDVLAHLAAWRAVEARQLERRIRGESGWDPGDPGPDVPVDEANEMLHAKYASWSWDDVVREADASVEALIAAIGRSGSTALSEREGIVVGIGTSGSNHAMGHLIDAARLAGARPRFEALERAFEEIVTRGHLAPRDSGVILYNLACYQALAGEADDARRLLRTAFTHRHELAEYAREDPDLATLRGERESLTPG
jgi:hypothetical protein